MSHRKLRGKHDLQRDCISAARASNSMWLRRRWRHAASTVAVSCRVDDHVFPAVLGDRRGCMSLVSLRTSNYLFGMHTQSNPAGLQPARPHGVASAPIWRLLAACRHTHMHTQHRRPARLLHVQKSARTSALHLHGRRACAGPRWSSSGRLTSTCGPLDGRLAPRHAAARRRRRRRAALSAVRGPMAAAAAAAAAELLGSAPTMAAAADKEPV